jgi:membrane-bound lytic murein transglycosylase MltF
MRKEIKIVIVLAVVILLFAVVLFVRHSRRQAYDLPEILKSGRLSVLTHSTTIGFSLKGDSVSGFQYEIVKAFADTLGVELVVSEQNDMKSCIDDLRKGDYNIVAYFIPVTTEWKKDALFTLPIITSRQVLVQRITKDSTASIAIKQQIELANTSIYISANSPFKMILKHLSDDIADSIHIVEVKNQNTEQLVRLVSEGKIKYTICEELFAQKLKLQYPDIDISVPVGFAQQLSWAVSTKSPGLLKELNDFLEDFVGSSAYWKIYSKYY